MPFLPLPQPCWKEGLFLAPAFCSPSRRPAWEPRLGVLSRCSHHLVPLCACSELAVLRWNRSAKEAQSCQQLWQMGHQPAPPAGPRQRKSSWVSALGSCSDCAEKHFPDGPRGMESSQLWSGRPHNRRPFQPQGTGENVSQWGSGSCKLKGRQPRSSRVWLSLLKPESILLLPEYGPPEALPSGSIPAQPEVPDPACLSARPISTATQYSGMGVDTGFGTASQGLHHRPAVSSQRQIPSFLS